MIFRVLFVCCIVLWLSKASLAETDDKKCTKMEGRTDTQSTMLRKELLCNYDRLTPPVNRSVGNRVDIKTMLIRYRVEYKPTDEWISANMMNSPNWFTIRTYVNLRWTDPRLKWNATKHNNKTRMYFNRNEIWMPDHGRSSHLEVTVVQNNGAVTMVFWTRLNGNCWPIPFSWGDQRECVLSFSVSPDDKVRLIRWKDDFDYQESKSATWQVIKGTRVFPLKEGAKNKDFEKINKERPWKYGPGYFETNVLIQRNFGIQDAAIFAPAAILVVLLVSSTWIPPMNESRVAMLSLIVVVQVYMFHQACEAMPFLPKKVVDIVDLYHDLIICSGVALVEWLLSYNIATLTQTQKVRGIPEVSFLQSLKNVFVVPEKGSRNIEIALLLDRVTFVVLSIISFILVLVLAKRPPTAQVKSSGVHSL